MSPNEPYPPFVEWAGDQQIPGPFSFEKVRLWGFPLRASATRLRRVVDRFLNLVPPDESGFEYRPWEIAQLDAGIVYMMVLEYPHMVSDDPVWRRCGYLSQHEFYFTLPVHRFEGGEWSRWALFTPYIFVDNAWSAICANLVLGYPKALGWFGVGSKIDAPYPLRVSTQTFPHFTPHTPLTWEPLIEIDRDPQAPPRWQPPEDFDPRDLWPLGPFRRLFEPGGAFGLEAELFERVFKSFEGRAPSFYDTVQLKQMRDAVDPTRAVYQRLVQWSVEIGEISAAGPLEPAVARLHATDTWPIAEQLGLEAPGGLLRSAWPYWVECDFSFVQPVNLA
jgi:hypothetical protein